MDRRTFFTVSLGIFILIIFLFIAIISWKFLEWYLDRIPADRKKVILASLRPSLFQRWVRIFIISRSRFEIQLTLIISIFFY